ncbi:tetratricopeptide repeat protein [Arcicella sp. DC2W]|uniref:Tetratricopeptide repeat protein n=1 Tax=Arcicella gelida TaxID=2984195 RepID=A0ABU5S3U3_9BACT|nr:tetratricopeptide repeat protein [Arcicella sp. DC2W]MEA5403126.1 tetratricopeptide repeat protein [Arcicella sp. DC2W]
MKKIFYLIAIFINFISCINAQDNKRMANINSIFDKMELQGVDTRKPLLFGYFFYDKDKSKLESLKNELLNDNYQLVRLEMSEKNEFALHVEKVEIHTRSSLLERENQLEKLSKKFKVETYDGWDVGNADSTIPLISKSDFEKSLETKTDEELYKLASELYDNETNDKAIIAFNKCIEKNIKLDTSNYKLGVSYIGLGQIKIGVTKLEQAVRLNPNYFKACFNLGAIYYDNQQYQKSVYYYQKAAKINPKDDKVLYGIAASQFVLGQFKDSETNCKMALKLNPNNTNASSLLDDMNKKK